jgi:hypothetical protein
LTEPPHPASLPACSSAAPDPEQSTGEVNFTHRLAAAHRVGKQCASSPAQSWPPHLERHTDCPLVTLGLVLDSPGFVRSSKMFAGNVSEGITTAFPTGIARRTQTCLPRMGMGIAGIQCSHFGARSSLSTPFHNPSLAFWVQFPVTTLEIPCLCLYWVPETPV